MVGWYEVARIARRARQEVWPPVGRREAESCSAQPGAKAHSKEEDCGVYTTPNEFQRG